ncbi:L,D-transpeptidase family protein [Hydrogenimonas sp.]
MPRFIAALSAILVWGMAAAFADALYDPVEANGTRWIEGDRLSSEAYERLTAIRSERTILCDKRRYRLDRIDRLLQNRFLEPNGTAELNRLLERAFLLYRSDLQKGCLDPLLVYPGRVSIELNGESRGSGEKNILLRRLEEGLNRYEAIEASGGWKSLPPLAGLLKKGDYSEAVPALRARLLASGDLNGTDVGDPFFDETLEAAVKRFQRRHALKIDGIVGPETRHAMNIPPQRKIFRIRLNIERLRWLTRGGGDFVVANIPDYSLTLYREGAPVLTMRTIVGRKERPTPMLSDMLTYAVLNPYWRAPKTIVREDILPKLKAGMFDHLQKIGIIVSRSSDGNESVDMRSIDWSRYDGGELPFVFMQKPGPLNYLGFVKFMFPNSLDIYIHDTPESRLFEYDDRRLSSGCIRVEKPVELFHALFNHGDERRWSYKRIVRQIVTNEERVVGLAEPIPVYILYMTTVADEKGDLRFLPDIYGYDRQMEMYLQTLERPVEFKRMQTVEALPSSVR